MTLRDSHRLLLAAVLGVAGSSGGCRSATADRRAPHDAPATSAPATRAAPATGRTSAAWAPPPALAAAVGRLAPELGRPAVAGAVKGVGGPRPPADLPDRDRRVARLDEHLRGLGGRAGDARAVVVDHVYDFGDRANGPPVLCHVAFVVEPAGSPALPPDLRERVVPCPPAVWALMAKDVEALCGGGGGGGKTDRALDFGAAVHSPLDVVLVSYFDGGGWRTCVLRGAEDWYGVWGSAVLARHPEVEPLYRVAAAAMWYLPLGLGPGDLNLSGYMEVDQQVEAAGRAAGLTPWERTPMRVVPKGE